MGLFTEGQKAVAASLYERSHQYLRQQNGMTHVMYLNVDTKFAGIALGCDSKMCTEINEFIVAMQKEGYEILDVKPTIYPEKTGVGGTRFMFLFQITYK